MKRTILRSRPKSRRVYTAWHYLLPMLIFFNLKPVIRWMTRRRVVIYRRVDRHGRVIGIQCMHPVK